MTDLRRTTRCGFAHHEAGHAIIGMQLGFRIVEASVEERQANGYICAGVVEFEPESALDIPRLIIRIAAGPAAQRFYCETINQAFNASGDEEAIASLQELLPGVPAARAAQVDALRRKANEMVSKLWPQIAGLAERLQIEGTIKGPDIFTAMAQGMRDFNDVLEPDAPFGRTRVEAN